MEIMVMHTPGHTPSCVTFVVGDAAFVGDTLFMPDYGTARADFPGGDAAVLYRPFSEFLPYPAKPGFFCVMTTKPRAVMSTSGKVTVEEQRASNIHIHDGISEQAFVEFRTQRDSELGMPKLILPSIQVNIRAGEMPPPDDSGAVFLKDTGQCFVSTGNASNGYVGVCLVGCNGDRCQSRSFGLWWVDS